jgi:ADP-ribose pyrophosphatase YjhB (NUDIX family)
MVSSVKKIKTRRSGQAKEVSVMAWLEDPYGQVLFVKQAVGKKLWTLPGGKVRRNESLLSALRREVKEETGLIVQNAAPLDLFDRYQKGNVTILYRVLIRKSASIVLNKQLQEITAAAYKASLPAAATPSARFFWARAQQSFEPLSMIRKMG